MMIPQLKPDIYRCIIDHLAAPTGPTHLESTRQENIRAQADLLNLGKANRVSSNMSALPQANVVDAIQYVYPKALYRVLHGQSHIVVVLDLRTTMRD